MWKTHMRLEDRIELYRLQSEGKTQKDIAKIVWYSQSTISKELKNKEARGSYNPLYADRKRLRLRKLANIKQRKLERHKDIREIIQYRLKNQEEDWSPDTIVWRISKELWIKICTKTVYNHIHRIWWDIQEKLRHGRKWYRKRGVVETRWKYGLNVPRIYERETIVETRERYWDREVDTVIGKWRQQRLVTLVERKSRLIRIKLRKWLWSVWVSDEIMNILSEYPKEYVRTITADNGKEFWDWKRVKETLWVWFYFAMPYHSWERWSNENGNRCIRKWLPKWTSFELLKDEDVAKIERMINNKPRKLLQYRTPYEVFYNIHIPYFL